ncbi:hypothetical protein [Nostoc sp. MG11]|uniref:hypothetical protein n=1 Tax=Nostoc sp. MG11 TaxID=2721166 RepID=UPI001866E514|nr:hypothetical protein [Nostoc sp. MG11]
MRWGLPKWSDWRGLGGISSLGGTSKNFEMLIRLGFHVKLTPMNHVVPLRVSKLRVASRREVSPVPSSQSPMTFAQKPH